MKDRIELLLKYIPVFTVICYICGFVICNSHLLQYGIIDTNIINVRFLEAGILYLMIAPFILATNFIINKKLGYFGSVFTALFAFIIYNSILSDVDYHFYWKAYLVVVCINSLQYSIIYMYNKDLEDGKNKFFDTLLLSFMIVMMSLLVFSIYFKHINTIYGGGKTYYKVLILKENKGNLIKVDSLMQTDTLSVLYENNEFIYFKDSNSTKSIRKDLIDGEILIK